MDRVCVDEGDYGEGHDALPGHHCKPSGFWVLAAILTFWRCLTPLSAHSPGCTPLSGARQCSRPQRCAASLSLPHALAAKLEAGDVPWGAPMCGDGPPLSARATAPLYLWCSESRPPQPLNSHSLHLCRLFPLTISTHDLVAITDAGVPVMTSAPSTPTPSDMRSSLDVSASNRPSIQVSTLLTRGIVKMVILVSDLSG